ncbi:DUF1707 domain-containing protein [Modestobacter sp. VKM Ac-2986]|uniref:DUF1707 SHOCT-like domain-containing protein n=1 Tax=Modestobacter sp. VKM Ac-2986 TaxID=3004140 RepID=UPI0022AB4A08|nr:DUF1707 domain-containing protein [Modestobacter sp. VKM Ac-2986]MCZ2827359.1 DUF1707 domain-containing protein [Modestobacter sp. VKM Ac-2986]
MPEPHLRAADVDRAAVADRLGAAMSTGRLTVTEYDERLSRAYAARTYGELAELTTDLPVTPAPVGLAAAEPVAASGACARTAHAGGDDLAAAWRNWAVTAVIVLVVWTVTSVNAGQVLYPWPVWVIGPWGAVLLSQSLAAHRGAGRDRLPG